MIYNIYIIKYIYSSIIIQFKKVFTHTYHIASSSFIIIIITRTATHATRGHAGKGARVQVQDGASTNPAHHHKDHKGKGPPARPYLQLHFLYEYK